MSQIDKELDKYDKKFSNSISGEGFNDPYFHAIRDFLKSSMEAVEKQKEIDMCKRFNFNIGKDDNLYFNPYEK